MDQQEARRSLALAAATDFEVRQIKLALSRNVWAVIWTVASGSRFELTIRCRTTSELCPILKPVPVTIQAYRVIPVGVSCREISVD